MIPIIIKMFETIQTKIMTVLEGIEAEFCTFIKSQNKTVSKIKGERKFRKRRMKTKTKNAANLLISLDQRFLFFPILKFFFLKLLQI